MAESDKVTTTRESHIPLDEDTLTYLRQKRVPDLMEFLLRSIIQEKPEKPTEFINLLTASPLPPNIMIAGPPASGKGSQAHHICAYYKKKYGKKPVHISSGDILREEVQKGSNLGLIADGYMKAGQLVPDSLIISIIRERLHAEDAIMNGWLLDGFPRNKEQAIALDAAGFCPQAFLVLDIPDDVLVERVEGRRVDPATGTIYHIKFNPPPEDDAALLDRLEQREDDNRTVLIPRLEEFHHFVDELLDYYAPITHRIDANRTEFQVQEDIQATLEKHNIA